MNIYDNVAFPLRKHTDKRESEIRQIVMDRLEEVGLTRAVSKFPGEVSGGMKKRAGFARALVLNPSVVMFDEPDSGLDPVRTSLLNDLILKVHAEHGAPTSWSPTTSAPPARSATTSAWCGRAS